MLSYIYARIIKKIQGKAIKGSQIHKEAAIGAGSTIVDCIFGKYSYCGYDCLLCNCEVGSFCSISDNVSVGGGSHPIEWVSTSSAFYKGRDSISKSLATLNYDSSDAKTIIGNDVWIGRGAYIKPGINIGNGAIIGMGSVVTKDIQAYTIVAGNPATVIRKRFDDTLCEQLEASKWWSFGEDKLRALSIYMNNPEEFIKESQNL